MASKHEKNAAALMAHALTLPGAKEEHPWGENVVKVGGKVFAYLGRSDADRAAMDEAKRAHSGEPGTLQLQLKLGPSRASVLKRAFATVPTEYGQGARGWIALHFDRGEAAPLDELRAWIEESYRIVAPKKLVAQLDGK